MSDKKSTLYIEVLDSGFIVTFDGKKVAKKDFEEVMELAKNHLSNLLQDLKKAGTSDMIVEMSSYINVPKQR
jgi:hypothetical protein